eukprot:snap_masked-scaffold_11-processed-gene-9.10-mRNA-1 protein AED:0.15 eAED:0.15 QI:0/-1/0/1/-1/1/1/0/362
MPKILIIGSGVIGLATAVQIRKKLGKQYEVIIYSPEHPSKTVSVVAGGHWEPFHVEPVDLANKWAEDTLIHYLKVLNGNAKCHEVETMPCVLYSTKETFSDEELPGWKNAANSFPNMEVVSMNEFASKCPEKLHGDVLKYKSVLQSTTIVMNTPFLLQQFIKKLETDPGVQLFFNEPRISSLYQLSKIRKKVGADLVINCTGLGAADFFPEEKTRLKPARGVVLYYQRPKSYLGSMVQGIRDGFLAPSEDFPVYTIPRGDVLVCGGTFLFDDPNPNPRPMEVEKIRENAMRVCPSVSKSKLIKQVVGFRPHRIGGIRFDCVEFEGGKIINNFGHSGGGWTLHIGAARATVSLIKELFSSSRL